MERPSESPLDLTEIDLTGVSGDRESVAAATVSLIFLAILQAVLVHLSAALPALLGAMLAAAALLRLRTQRGSRLALAAWVLIVPTGILMVFTGILLLLAGGQTSADGYFRSGGSIMLLPWAGLACAMPVILLPRIWRLARRDYSADIKQILYHASLVERAAERLQVRFSLWAVPMFLSGPLLLALSFLIYVIVRPMGGPFGKVGRAPWEPFDWFISFRRFHGRHTQLTVEEGLARDKRAPILLLRSFADDSLAYPLTETLQERYLGSFLLEEVLARELSRCGPPIAMGAPGETLPPIGAYRQYCSGTDWQDVVRARMAEAQFIVVVASNSPRVGWELEQVVENNHLAKCMLVFPPLEAPAYRRRVDALSPIISDVLSAAALQRVVSRRPIALVFGSSPTAFLDDNMTKAAYVLAVQAVLGGARHRRSPDAAKRNPGLCNDA